MLSVQDEMPLKPGRSEIDITQSPEEAWKGW
jgi:hypothetical protein